MITLYARREPTTDSVTLLHNVTGKLDVVLYSDVDCNKQVARHSWFYSNVPTKRNKYVMHNCNKYKLEWVS